MPKKKPLANTVKTPPNNHAKSIQYDLFTQFVTNEKAKVSNTVEIWDSIPKYFFTARQTEKLRTESGHADPFEWPYVYEGEKYTVSIQPALIKQDDGKYKAFLPGATEELIEEALKKILSDQQYGYHDEANAETWVKFTLKMIERELKDRIRSRNIKEIKHAIQVMSKCVFTVFRDGKELWRGQILSDLVTVGRDDYLEDTGAFHAARLSVFISKAINQNTYRQLNYAQLMLCDEQLTRWIYRRLVNRYRQANHTNDYHFMYSDLQGSGLLQQGRENDNRIKVLSALKELTLDGEENLKPRRGESEEKRRKRLEKKAILSSFSVDTRKEGRKIVDVKYTLFPSVNFVQDQKAANKRASDNRQVVMQGACE